MTGEPPQPDQIYLQLRQRILTLTPGDIGLEPGLASSEVWGIMMETGYEVGSATLVYLSDGTIGLYFSTGGGMLGTTENSLLAEAVKAMLKETESHIQDASPADAIPLPAPGQVSFTLLTFKGTRTISAIESSIADSDHPLNPLYQAGHRVMYELHSLAQKGKSVHNWRSHQ
jgi:hypothetical protein